MPIVRDSSLRPEVGTRSAYRRFTGYLMPSWLTHLSRRSPPTTVTSARRGCLLMGSARTSSVLVRSKRDRRVAFGAVDHAAIAGSITKAKIFMLDKCWTYCFSLQLPESPMWTVHNATNCKHERLCARSGRLAQTL